MIELVHLRILRALQEQGSLSAAAESLHLTQSALSHSIRKLEHYYGLTVWQREGRRLRLTRAGEYLQGLGEQLLPLMEQADETLRAYAEGKRGKLRIGMECHPCYEWLLTVVEPFLRQWPDVDLDVVQRFRFNGLEALENHHIDMLITSDPVEDPNLVNTPVFNYELQLVVPADHSLARKKYVRPTDLQPQRLYTFPVARERLDVFTRFLIPAGVEPRHHETVETMEIMLQLVAANRGLCTLPGWLVERFARDYGVRDARLGEEGVQKKLYLVFRRQDADVNYVRSFVDMGSRAGPEVA